MAALTSVEVYKLISIHPWLKALYTLKRAFVLIHGFNAIMHIYTQVHVNASEFSVYNAYDFSVHNVLDHR